MPTAPTFSPATATNVTDGDTMSATGSGLWVAPFYRNPGSSDWIQYDGAYQLSGTKTFNVGYSGPADYQIACSISHDGSYNLPSANWLYTSPTYTIPVPPPPPVAFSPATAAYIQQGSTVSVVSVGGVYNSHYFALFYSDDNGATLTRDPYYSPYLLSSNYLLDFTIYGNPPPPNGRQYTIRGSLNQNETSSWVYVSPIYTIGTAPPQTAVSFIDTITNASAIAAQGGTLTYQWYLSSNSDGAYPLTLTNGYTFGRFTVVSGTSATLQMTLASGTSHGTYYVYCKATNTLANGQTAFSNSRIATLQY
jgi:hypothetical protein